MPTARMIIRTGMTQMFSFWFESAVLKILHRPAVADREVGAAFVAMPVNGVGLLAVKKDFFMASEPRPAYRSWIVCISFLLLIQVPGTFTVGAVFTPGCSAICSLGTEYVACNGFGFC